MTLLLAEQCERHHATAVILAGGKSTRMGCDKRFLPIQGKPMVQHVCDQVAPLFVQTIIVAAELEEFRFGTVSVVSDDMPGLGPLGGISTALAASRHDPCFVLPCDMPRMDFALMARLLQAAPDADCTLPVSRHGRFEPLFGVYRKSALPHIMQAVAAGERKVMRALATCNVATVLMWSERLDNLNTPEDYYVYGGSKRGVWLNAHHRMQTLRAG